MAMQPFGTRFDIIIAAQRHDAVVPIKLVEIVKSPRLRAIEVLVLQVRGHVFKMLPNVGRPELLARVEMDKRRILEDVIRYILEDPTALLDVPLLVGLARRLVSIPRALAELPGLLPFYPTQLLLGLVTGGRQRGRIVSKVVYTAQANPSAELAIQEVRTTVDPAAVTDAFRFVGLGRVEDFGEQPGTEAEGEEDAEEDGGTAQAIHGFGWGRWPATSARAVKRETLAIEVLMRNGLSESLRPRAQKTSRSRRARDRSDRGTDAGGRGSKEEDVEGRKRGEEREGEGRRRGTADG